MGIYFYYLFGVLESNKLGAGTADGYYLLGWTGDGQGPQLETLLGGHSPCAEQGIPLRAADLELVFSVSPVAG